MGSVATIACIDLSNGLPISEGGNDQPVLEEARANARLIARAPELRDLLVRMTGADPRDYAAHIMEARCLLDKVDG